MTSRHKYILEQIKLDSIEIDFVDNSLTPGQYEISEQNGIYKYRMKVNKAILDGTDPNFSDKRIELVLYHEWGHIKDCRKDPNNFFRLNSNNKCHEDLEYEAFYYALKVAFEEAKTGNNSLLQEAVLRYKERFVSEPNEGYRKALCKIFSSPLWIESEQYLK